MAKKDQSPETQQEPKTEQKPKVEQKPKMLKKVLVGRGSLRLGYPGVLIRKGEEVEFSEDFWKGLPANVKGYFKNPAKTKKVK